MKKNGSMKKTVLLTGAAGFIGSNFLRYLFDKYPHYSFLVLDNLTYAGNQENIPHSIKASSRFEFWYGSITNAAMVQMLFEKADWVVHFAAETHVARSIFDNTKFFETDVLGTQVLMNALVKANHIEKFVHISTSEVYGTGITKMIDEDHALNPRSPYASAKVGADRLVYSYWCTYDIPAVIIRPFNNYGPLQHLEKVVPRFITSALQDEPLTIHGDGSAQRDWLYVEDHCQALDRVLHVPFDTIAQQVINIGTGKAISNLYIAELVLSYLNKPYSLLKFIGDRPGQVHYHCSSTEKAEQLLAWQTQTSFENGLKKTIDWYEEHESWWKKLEWMKQVPIRTINGITELH